VACGRQAAAARGLWATLLTVLALLCGACDDNALRSGIVPRIEPDPFAVTLSAVPVGERLVRPLRLRNVGGPGSELVIVEIGLSNSVDTREVSLTHDPLPVTLRSSLSGDDAGAGSSFLVNVNYAPQREGEVVGFIRVQSNDPETPTLEVPLRTSQNGAQLVVNPFELDFGAVDTGSTQRKSVRVSNIGTVPARLADVRLSPETSADFTITAGGDARPTLVGETSLDIEVTYTPRGLNRDSGLLVITPEDPGVAPVTVPIRGLEPSPEITLSHESINFGALALGATSDAVQVTVLNEGDAPLVVDSIGLAAVAPPTNEQFLLEGLPAAWPLTLAPRESAQFGVRFHPLVEGRFSTSVAVRSNDVDEPIVLVRIDGRVRQACISVLPAQVELGRVALGVESVRQSVQIANCGDLPLNLGPLTLSGDAGFAFAPVGAAALPATLAPLEAANVEVWYTNRDLAEGAPAQGTLSIPNDTPGQPVVEVPLSVVGGGAPTCQLVVLGSPVAFGVVSRGSTATRPVTVLNRGSGNCEVRNQTIDYVPPFLGNPVNPFTVTRPLARAALGPGSLTPMQLGYTPRGFQSDQGTLNVTYYDPYLREERAATAQLVGVGGDNGIEVIPGRLDFGQVTAAECASREERVTVYNTGIAALCIQDIALEGPNCDEFAVVGRPAVGPDGCITVTRNTPAGVTLVYEPDNLGADECDLVFRSNDQDNPELRVPLRGDGVATSVTVDEFVQTSGQQVDILFVVDNSGSMAEEQQNLRDNFDAFIRGADRFQNDFQIGVVTTDISAEDQSGRLQGNPRIIRTGPNAERQFSETANVGDQGLGDEKGLEAAYLALSDPLAFDSGVACRADADCAQSDRCVDGVCGGPNRGFIRPDAALEVIFLSDEEDQSPNTLNFYVDYFKSIKGVRNEGRFHAHAIVGADARGNADACQSADGAADAGRRYIEVAQRTNGTVYSICEANYAAGLREIANSAFGLPVQFFLSRPAVGARITVEVDGRARAAGWAFDEASNSVIFDEASVPQAGQRIRVTYEAACFQRQ